VDLFARSLEKSIPGIHLPKSLKLDWSANILLIKDSVFREKRLKKPGRKTLSPHEKPISKSC